MNMCHTSCRKMLLLLYFVRPHSFTMSIIILQVLLPFASFPGRGTVLMVRFTRKLMFAPHTCWLLHLHLLSFCKEKKNYPFPRCLFWDLTSSSLWCCKTFFITASFIVFFRLNVLSLHFLHYHCVYVMVCKGSENLSACLVIISMCIFSVAIHLS